MDRRDFLKRGGIAGAAIAAGGWKAIAGDAPAEKKPAPMPTIRLGGLEVSRLLLGTNPFFGFAHRTGDIGQKMKDWYTDDRIIEALEAAAAEGINVVVGPPYERWQKLWARYRKDGGKLQHWISQPDRAPEKIPAEIEESVRAGASAVYIQGHKVEAMFEKGTFEVVKEWVDLIRRLKVPAGIGSHRPDCHLEAQRRGYPVDFYFQCMFNVAHGDTFEKGDPDRAVETIRQLEKPVVAYKILGAGRLPADAAFDFAFKNIRKTDGVCVGMYTGEDRSQIAANAALARKYAAKYAEAVKS